MANEEGQWKNLTNDVLALILNSLHTNSDLCRLRSICKSWRSFATPNQHRFLFPLTLPPLLPNSRPLSLSPTLIYIFSPNPNNSNDIWLSKVSETGENKWALLNPLTKHKLYFFSSGVFKGRINLMGFRNLEVGRSYRVHLVTDHGDEDDTFGFEEFTSSMISLRKVVVRIGEDVSVLGLYGYGKIAAWNSGDEDWKIIETGMKEKRNEFDDVICFDGRFFAVDRTGRLVMIGSRAAVGELVEVVGATEECNGQYFYLVESNFRLYLVNKIVNPMPTNYYDEEEEEWVVDKCSVGKPLGFKVFALNEKGKSWERVTSLENKVLFVSRDAAFSVCAEDLGWSKGDCIYFEGVTGYDDEADMTFGLNAGVYTLEDGAILTFGSSMDHWTRIFWPPSCWFVQDEEYHECARLD